MTYRFIDVFIITIPETLITLLVALQLLGLSPNFGKLMLVCTLQGFATYAIRQIHVYTLLHSLLQLLVCILLVVYILKVDFKLVFVSLVITVVVYGFIEQIFTSLVLSILHVSLYEVMKNQLLELVAFSPQFLFMILVYFLLRRFNLTLTNTYSKEE
ncbi:hypothetical protein [Caldanaerobius polysaccharolyticus]|uniref:hypothetical protein n=1 Tax=Caldanaerobius polysaccharolyticus TaxID=44256 RepID=UPI0004796720|nr:hypothetical protein [Caldanaerobius polysaccharolyticus]